MEKPSLSTKYKYDVAFSFLARDEPLAIELNDLLQGRLNTFLYSKKQEELAGTDGEKQFNAVFGKEARLVAVLYRAGWGESPWTRIEQTAIRNRAFDEGYDFVKLIPLDDQPDIPKWFPRTNLWIGLSRWGPSGAASVIEARVQELGGEPREESVADKAIRVDRSIKFSEIRKQFLNSYDGVNASNALFEALKQGVQSELAAIAELDTVLQFSFKEQRRQFAILGRGPALLVFWNYHYANTLDKAQLEATLWRGHPPWPGKMHYEHPQELKKITFTFDMTPSGKHHWISTSRDNRSFSSAELASYIVGYAIEQADKYE